MKKPETLPPAFSGADKVLVLSNYPVVAIAEGNAYIGAKAAGVKHIVKLYEWATDNAEAFG